jgi:hypothetical protein
VLARSVFSNGQDAEGLARCDEVSDEISDILVENAIKKRMIVRVGIRYVVLMRA